MKHDEKSTTHYACDIGIANGSCCGCSGHQCHQRPECCPKCEDKIESIHSGKPEDGLCSCHQRPETHPNECNECILKGTTIILCDFHQNNGFSFTFGHQRPESGWEQRFDELVKQTAIFKQENWVTKDENDLKSFIAAQRRAAYEFGVKDTNFQMARLLENNEELTKKLRAVNRQILEEIISHAERKPHWDEFRVYMEMLLSFQQEPRNKDV